MELSNEYRELIIVFSPFVYMFEYFHKEIFKKKKNPYHLMGMPNVSLEISWIKEKQVNI